MRRKEAFALFPIDNGKRPSFPWQTGNWKPLSQLSFLGKPFCSKHFASSDYLLCEKVRF